MLAGLVCALPEADSAPPGVTATAVAPVVLQLSVVCDPAGMLVGLALKLLITGRVAVGVGVDGIGVTGAGAGTGAET